MRIYGYFASVKGDIYRVDISIATAADDIEIMPDSSLQFAEEDAVTIESGVDNSFDVVQQQICTLSLQAAGYIPQLFTLEYKDARVEVSRVVSGYLTAGEQTECVFSGWLEPRTLSQPFNERYDDLSLQAVDCLSAMQYSPFRSVGAGATYNSAVRNAGQSTFLSLLSECLTAGCGSLDAYAVFYDGSKAIDGNSIFGEITVKDMLFLGDDADDTVNCRDVVEDLLKYLNLHIAQYGRAFYIYSWESLRKGGVAWTQILGGAGDITPPQGGTVAVTNANADDTDTQIDITEVFNQVALSVSLKKQDAAIVSPLDSSGKVPVMGPRHPYVTEFAADGEGERAQKSFYNLVTKGSDETQWGDATYKDYYVRVLRNVNWTIGSKGTDWAQTQADADPANPNAVVTRLSKERGALLLSIGSVDHKPGKGDDSPQATISMDDCLVVSVNGNGNDTTPSPAENDLLAIAPIAEYNGGGEGTVYSPAEEGAVNYLVIDGSVTLLPLMDTSAAMDKVQACTDWWGMFSILNFHTVPSRVNEDGRFLTFGWWKPFSGTGAPGIPFTETTNATGYALLGTSASDHGWIPDTGDGPQQYEYVSKSGSDEISKVGILECMLVIGDTADGTAMVLVEDEGTYGNGSGAMDKLSWQPYRTMEQCGNDPDTYYAQSFAIGINPKKGDKIIGTAFDIATNFDYNTNISAEKGMAIPLPHDKKLSGRIMFKILGPVNESWDSNVRRHRTWFRREKWTTTTVPLLAHVSSIIVKSLSIKMYTATEDSGGGDADVVYLSKVSHAFYNKKEGLEFKVHSGFTQQEISQYSLSDSALVGMVYGPDKLPLLAVEDKNTGNRAKPEKIYVDAAYTELHAPRIMLTQTLRLQGKGVSPFALYVNEALNKLFYVLCMDRNLMAGSAQLTLEECF